MHRTLLLQELSNYRLSQHIAAEELPVVKQFINFINQNTDCFERSNKGHITASAWIVNHDFSKVLLTHHRKLNMWLQLGGHADGDPDTKAVALKEAQEESGIEQFSFLIPTIFDIDVHPLPSACEYHYDIRYLLQVPKDTQFVVSHESLDLAWVDHHELPNYSSEQSILRMHEKLQKILNQKTNLKEPKLII